jgi:fructose-bisphosphate aldolase, class II
MPLVSYADLLRNAQRQSYAVGAFNVFGLEFLPVILQAAEEENSPVLLQINPMHYPWMDPPAYLGYVKEQLAKTSVPAGLNLDHGKGLDVIVQGIQAGFPSVMYDGSALPFADNVEKTREVVRLCRPCGVTVEAELGTLNDEGLDLTEANQDLLFTDPSVAAQFVEETGVDALAVSIGNAHGFYRGKPQLDFERLKKIADATSAPLVLHGGSGISDDDFRTAISLGICKINIYTEMSAAASDRIRELAVSQDRMDYPTLLMEARASVKSVVVHKLRMFGSSGQA